MRNGHYLTILSIVYGYVPGNLADERIKVDRAILLADNYLKFSSKEIFSIFITLRFAKYSQLKLCDFPVI